jgi:hypothetical protein
MFTGNVDASTCISLPMGNRKPRPYLVGSAADTGSGRTGYETGAIVPQTGIYLVVHSAHRLPHEVVVIEGHRFPKCQKCGDAVLFELLHPAADLFRHINDFVYELPEIKDEEDSAIA